MSSEPVFVRGFSRSGGTLMVTILDAHPELAMSYELYPNLLEGALWREQDLIDLAKLLESAGSLSRAAKKVSDRGLRTFFLRCARGGLNNRDVAELLKQHVRQGSDLMDVAGRMRFIERTSLAKVEREGKSRWGLKCSSRYEEYLRVWPGAFFLNMVRDGRDVLASQLGVGSFNKSPKEVGTGWARTNLRFRELVEDPAVKALEVSYERLTTRSENEVRRICDFLELAFVPEMLAHHKQDLTIFSAQHLSQDRVSKPIDSTRIGRWRKDLSEDELSGFYTTAETAMALFGYTRDEDAHRPD